jgi:tRNA wybutosine-synthesizing protein 3
MVGDKGMVCSPAIIVKKGHGEAVYHFLKQKKWLQSEKHPKEIGNELLAIPINEICPLTEDEISIIIHEEIIDIRIENIEMITNPPSVEPHARLHQFITQWLQSNLDIADTISHRSKEEMMRGLLSELPKKWEKLGDLILLPQTAFSSEKWISIISEENQLSLWKCIAEALKVERIGKQKFIKDDVIRSSQAQLLLGDSSWVELLDYGVKFGFDACKVMYSSGNVTERHRIGNMDMKGETIIDCYAGIGYYTLPMLVRGGAILVHACEINHHSITALEWGARANNVSDKLIIHQGDNAHTMIKLEGIADRCHLGLLPSSQSAWKLAIACLKEKGGILHIHMNVEEEKIEQWIDSTIHSLQQYAIELKRNYNVEVLHLEKVKWFAPRVRHVVLDVEFIHYD